MSTSAADDTATFAGKFVDFRTTSSTDKKKSEVTIKCGNCQENTSALVPRDEYHVVTVGLAVGIFANGAIADTLINGVEGFQRKKLYSWEEASDYFRLALGNGAVHVKSPVAKHLGRSSPPLLVALHPVGVYLFDLWLA
ncbi:hypothetical protein MD484_g5011, partial [Candolleomyces efflorescens]